MFCDLLTNNVTGTKNIVSIITFLDENCLLLFQFFNQFFDFVFFVDLENYRKEMRVWRCSVFSHYILS